MKESKEDRFCRVAEARVNKIIKMMRLLGNCSNNAVYAFSPEQVEQIFEGKGVFLWARTLTAKV